MLSDLIKGEELAGHFGLVLCKETGKGPCPCNALFEVKQKRGGMNQPKRSDQVVKEHR